MTQTRIFFGSFGAPEYPGASRMSVSPELAESWHCVVGGTQCAMTKETIGVHMPRFLKMAYEAGRNDERARIVSNLVKEPTE